MNFLRFATVRMCEGRQLQIATNIPPYKHVLRGPMSPTGHHQIWSPPLAGLRTRGFFREAGTRLLWTADVSPSPFNSLSRVFRLFYHLGHILSNFIGWMASCSTSKNVISVKDSSSTPWGLRVTRKFFPIVGTPAIFHRGRDEDVLILCYELLS